MLSVQKLKSCFYPVVSFRQSAKRTELVLELSKLLLWVGVVTHAVLASVSIRACLTYYSCSEYYPTTSYLASVRGYDKPITFAFTVFGFGFAVFDLAAFSQYKQYMGKLDSLVLVFIGLLSSLAIPSVAVMDELQSSSNMYLEKVHLLLVSGILSLKVLWAVFSLPYLWKLYKESSKARKTIKQTGVYLALWSMAFYVSYKYWKEENFNYQNYESFTEQVFISLSLYFPYFYSRNFIHLKTKFEVEHKPLSVLS